jgi:hypothetical protein
MSTGKLKAQYNRVRTSNALQSHSIWANTIGIESDQGGNSAVEAMIPAPMRGGPGRAAKRQAAQDLMAAAGYQPAVTSYEGLIALAKASGSMDTAARGACKLCGGLGHLTKQCKNVVGRPGGAAAGGDGAHQLLAADVDELSDLSSLSSSSSDSSDSDSSGERRRKRKSRGRERSRSRSRSRERSSKRSTPGKSKSSGRDKEKKRKHKSKDKSKHKSKKSKKSKK